MLYKKKKIILIILKKKSDKKKGNTNIYIITKRMMRRKRQTTEIENQKGVQTRLKRVRQNEVERIEGSDTNDSNHTEETLVDIPNLKDLYDLIQKSTQTLELKLVNLEKRIQNVEKQDKESSPELNGNSLASETTFGGETSSIPSMQYNIINMATEKPKFNKGKIHPVTFLEDLISYMRKIPSKNNEVDIAYECLQGEARDWARVYYLNWKNLEDFKKDFLNTFWGEFEQSKIRRQIVYGKWNVNTHRTMLSHFLSLTSRAHMLTTTIPENQLVADMIRHYPKNVQILWKGKTILQMTEFLKNIDDINQNDEEYLIQPYRRGIQNNVENNLNKGNIEQYQRTKLQFKNWRQKNKKNNQLQTNILQDEKENEHYYEEQQLHQPYQNGQERYDNINENINCKCSN